MLRNIFKVILTLLFGTIPFFNCSRHLKKDVALLDYSYDYEDSHDCENVLIGYRNSIIFYDNQKFTIYSHRSSRGNRIFNNGTLDSTTYTELQKYWAECQGDSVKDYYKPEDLKKNEVCQELTIYYGKERKVIRFCERVNNLPFCIREIIRISTSPTITANLVNSPPLLTYAYGGNDHEITYNNDRSFTAYSRTSSRGKKKWISNKGTLDSTTFVELQKYLAECQGDSVKIYYKPVNPQLDDTWQELNIYNGQTRKVIIFCERDKNLPLCVREIVRISTTPSITANFVNYPSLSKKIMISCYYYHMESSFRKGGSYGVAYYNDHTTSHGDTLDSATYNELQKYWAECQDDSIKTSYECIVKDAPQGVLTIYFGLEQKTITFYRLNKNLPACIRGIIKLNESPK